MKNWYPGLVLIIASIALLPFPAQAKVWTTLHRDADLSGYRTFGLESFGPPPGEAAIPGESIDAIVGREIELQLSRMGYVKSTGDTRPDFIIQYNASSLEAYVVGERPRPLPLPFNEYDWDTGEFELLSGSFAQGTLFLTMRDGATDEPVWCGWTTEVLKPGKLERRTRKFVRRILGRYPSISNGRTPRP